MDSTMTSADAAPTTLMPALADRCAACGALLAGDQRYCLSCGERRGEPRLPFMDGRRVDPLTTTAVAPPAPARSRLSRASANTALVAGVGTLMLAMGVGVLIGRSGPADTAHRPPVQVVTVAGAGGIAGDSAGAANPAATDTAASKSDANGGASKHGKHAKAKVTGLASNPAQVLAKKVGKVVKLGQKGHGPGYQHGKFTGNFFGP